jgi:hypothetical protein
MFFIPKTGIVFATKFDFFSENSGTSSGNSGASSGNFGAFSGNFGDECIASAHAAGLFTIAVNTGPLSDACLLDAGADLLFRRMADVVDAREELMTATERKVKLNLHNMCLSATFAG